MHVAKPAVAEARDQGATVLNPTTVKQRSLSCSTDRSPDHFPLLRAGGRRSDSKRYSTIDLISEQFIEICARANLRAIDREQVFAGLDFANGRRSQRHDLGNPQGARAFTLLAIESHSHPAHHGRLRAALRP